MGNKITVISRPGTRVTIASPTSRNQVKTVNVVGATNIGAAGITTLTDLRDVISADASNNDTLVYDEASGKYIVKELPIINGGTF
jgi:hypothetical protein